jgi:hypothetical protein
MPRLPDFLIIGAMKSATSTLHRQLAAQPEFWMSSPKEHYFLSDDALYGRGAHWYAQQFRSVSPNLLLGVSNTHCTKLPTYPRVVERIQESLPDAKFIYVMRNPLERIISQYLHEWLEREVSVSFERALLERPELIAYSQYARQLRPYLEAFGPQRVLPVFVSRLRTQPQLELERVAAFLGGRERPIWRPERAWENVSAQRLRFSWWRDAVLYAPGVSQLRQALPQQLRDRFKRLWRRPRPVLTTNKRAQLAAQLDPDLAELGTWLGAPELTCENFDEVTKQANLGWQVDDERLGRTRAAAAG